MKKILSALLIAVMFCFALTACNEKTDTSTQTVEQENARKKLYQHKSEDYFK